MKNIRVIHFNSRKDERGVLTPIEWMKDIPFNIKRIFYIKDMNEIPRGNHAHRKTKQVLIPIKGGFDLELTDGVDNMEIHMDSSENGIFIPTYIWLRMKKFTTDCIIMVLCSHEYDETEYIRDYDEFLKGKNEGKSIHCFSLEKQTDRIKDEVIGKLNSLIESNQFVLGKELKTFEENFAKYNNIKYCVGVSDGTSAMVAALKSLKLSPGDEVIVQSNTYIAAPLAIVSCNLKVKVVDIDDTLNIDLTKLEQSITKKTKAIIVVHLYGTCPDMHKLMKIKETYGLYLIEDAAQAHGSIFDGKKLGTFGDIGCFSFYPSKNLGAYGEGGCILTDNLDHYDYILRYRNYGSVERYKWEIKGVNCRMHNVQAGVLNIKIKYLDDWNRMRSKLARVYDKLLSEVKGVEIVKNHDLLFRNYHLYVILIDHRDELVKYLKLNNVGTAIHYPNTFYKSEAFEEMNHLEFKADNISKRIISLPMYPELAIESVEKVCNLIKSFYQSSEKV